MSSDPEKMMSKADKMYAFLLLSIIYVNDPSMLSKREFELGFRAFLVVNRDDFVLVYFLL